MLRQGWSESTLATAAVSRQQRIPVGGYGRSRVSQVTNRFADADAPRSASSYHITCAQCSARAAAPRSATMRSMTSSYV
eukprot:6204250-Pleurochrysis_carterae.AAC.2